MGLSAMVEIKGIALGRNDFLGGVLPVRHAEGTK